MYRLVTESLLGLQLDMDRLRFTPRLPDAWKSVKMHYRYRETFYHIVMRRGDGRVGVEKVIVDGTAQPEHTVLLKDDRGDHQVEVHLE